MKYLSREEIFTILWGQKKRTMYSMTRNVFIFLKFGQYLPQIESKIGNHQLRKQLEHSESVRCFHALLTRPPPRAPTGSAERAPLRLHGHMLHISGDRCTWVLVSPVPKFLTLLGAGTPLSRYNRCAYRDDPSGTWEVLENLWFGESRHSWWQLLFGLFETSTPDLTPKMG